MNTNDYSEFAPHPHAEAYSEFAPNHPSQRQAQHYGPSQRDLQESLKSVAQRSMMPQQGGMGMSTTGAPMPRNQDERNFNPLSNLLGGAVSGMQGMGKMLFPEEPMENKINPWKHNIREALLNSDPYKALGTTDQPLSTLGGLEQGIGGFLPFGRSASKGMELGKALINHLKEPIKNLPGNIIDKFSPETHANAMIRKLGRGVETADENSASLAEDIRNAHDPRLAESKSYFDHALNQAGHEDIYDKPNPLITTRLDEAKHALGEVKDLNVGNLQKAFEHKQSFGNAHKLQSELGTWIGDLERKLDKSAEDKASLQKIRSVREQLKEGINNFLERRDKTSNTPLAPTYKKGVDLYRENVAHYLSDPKLRDIVNGGQTDIKDIQSIFENPTNFKKGADRKLYEGPINKLMKDLPEEAKNKVIFSAIGGSPRNANALLDRLGEVRNKGFSKYFTPEIKEDINALNKKIKNKERLIKTGKYTGAIGGVGLLGGAANSLINKL